MEGHSAQRTATPFDNSDDDFPNRQLFLDHQAVRPTPYHPLPLTGQFNIAHDAQFMHLNELERSSQSPDGRFSILEHPSANILGTPNLAGGARLPNRARSYSGEQARSERMTVMDYNSGTQGSDQSLSMPNSRTTIMPDRPVSTQSRPTNRIAESSATTGSAQNTSITVRTPAARMTSSGAGTPELRSLPQTFIEGVGNKHCLSGDNMRLLQGFSQIAAHRNPVLGDLGARVDQYALMLSVSKSNQNLEKAIACLPEMKRKIDELEEKLTKAPYEVPKQVRDAWRQKCQIETYKWDCTSFTGVGRRLIDELKSSEEIQKSYGLQQTLKNESHRKTVEKVFRDIAASVRDNLRRDFLASIRAGHNGKDLKAFTIACSKKYQHLNGATAIDKNYLYRNAVLRCFIALNAHSLRFKEGGTGKEQPAEHPEESGSGTEDDEGEGDDETEGGQGNAKRAKTDGKKSTGRVTASEDFWGQLEKHLTKQFKKYKSSRFTSDEWKGRIEWIMEYGEKDQYNGIKKGLVLDEEEGVVGRQFQSHNPPEASDNLSQLLG